MERVWSGADARTIRQGRGVGAVINNHLVHGLVYGVRRHARLRAQAALTSARAAAQGWHTSGSLAAGNKARRTGISAKQARARARTRTSVPANSSTRAASVQAARIFTRPCGARRARQRRRAAPPPASPDARPSLQRKDLMQHACSSPAIHDPKLASRKTAVVGTAGAAAKLGAHLRVVDLHLVVERVLAGVHVRRPHDVLRHRQPRRHGVRPQLCARRAGSARARAP